MNNFPSHGNNLGMLVVSMTSRALVKKIVQEKGAEPRLYLFDGERFTDALDGAEERPGERTSLPLQSLKYYASPRQNYGVGTFHISNKTLRLKTEVCTKGFSRLIVINLYFPYSMYPQLEEVHGLVRKTAKDFVKRRVEPNARRIDQG